MQLPKSLSNVKMYWYFYKMQLSDSQTDLPNFWQKAISYICPNCLLCTKYSKERKSGFGGY